MLKVKNLSFGYQETSPLFDDVSFDVDAGAMIAIMGKNGVGKTTLMQCILGIHTPCSGSVVFEDDAKGHVSYVPQKQHIDVPYIVETFVCMGLTRHLSVFGVPSQSHIDKAHRVLATLDILHLKDARCDRLSGGQVQLVYLARALVSEPRLIILDEPENHLDIRHHYRLYQRLQTLVSENNISVMVNTHDVNAVLRYFDDVLLMQGTSIRSGSVSDVLDQRALACTYDVEVDVLSVGKDTVCIVRKEII